MQNLPEQLLLLALQQGRCSSLRFGLIGAIIDELMLQGALEPAAQPALPDPLLNEALSLLYPKRGRSAKFWVNYLSPRLKRLVARLAEPLIEQGIVRLEQRKILGLFPSRRYRIADPDNVEAIQTDLREAIFQPQRPSARQAALLSLLQPTGIKLFSREERATVKQRLAELRAADPISRAVSAAIAEQAVAAILYVPAT